MDTCHLRNKIAAVLIIILSLFILYKCNSESGIADGNFTKPIINVNGQLYGTCIVEDEEVAKEYSFYGYVGSSVKEKIGVPDKDLQITEIMKDNIGYKVYISKDKQFVAIFNEEIQKYNYYEKEN